MFAGMVARSCSDLTPLGFYRLQQRLDLVADLERDLFCVDDSGNVSIYRVQAASDPANLKAAALRLGLLSIGGETS